MSDQPLKRRWRAWPGSGLLGVFLLALPIVALVAVLLLKPALMNDEDAESPLPLAEAPTVTSVAPQPAVPGPVAKAPAREQEQQKEPPPAPDGAAAPPEQAATMPQPAKTTAAAPPVEQHPAANPTAPPGPPPPWQAALEAGGDLPGYRALAMQPFEESFDRATREDLSAWFEPVAGAGFRIGKVATRYGQSGTIEGLGRLRSPWPEGAVLRLELENCNHLQLHFFRGEIGASLVYYADPGDRWAAYATRREANKPTPGAWALTATDDDRCRRTEFRQGGPVELRYRDGEVLLSRGDVVLLAAPLPGPPADVFFEGRATIHGLSLARTSDAPPVAGPLPIALEIDRPANLAWTATAPDVAQPEKLADGSIRLAGDKLPGSAACVTPLPRSGLQEIILEVADAAPGAGISLRRAAKMPAEVLGFCRDRAGGGLALKLLVNNQWQANVGSPVERPAALANSHCWIRLLVGCGNLRWWLSTDGVHWAEPEPPRDRIAPGIESIGLEIAAGAPQTQLTLKRIVLRELTGLTSLAEADLAQKATILPAAKSLDEWLAAVLAKKPADADAAAWLRAATIRTLGAGARRELAYPLLEALLDDAAARKLPLAAQLAALHDAALLSLDTNDQQTMRENVLSRYAALGIRAAEEAGLPAWESVRQAYFTAPIGRWRQTPGTIDRAIRWQLIRDAYEARPELLEVVQSLRFFHLDRGRPLVDWAESLARRATGSAISETSRPQESWRELLAPQLGKEAYASLTELTAAVESEAWDDAARLIASLTPQSAPGVAPSAGDKNLLTSMPIAVKLALETHPPLRQALEEKFGPLAKLRLSQATAAGDAAAVELATVQFAGTPAAAEAHRWLGDRALVAGQFERAIVAYESALSQAAGNPAAQARLRLAAAMVGREAGEPVTQAVEFGQVTMTAAEFERLVAEMRARGAQDAALQWHGQPGRDGQEARATATPQPTGFETHVRSRLDGPVGERPEEEVGRRTNQLRVPWVDRQLATAIAGSTLYVSNRFQVAAYSLETGARLWQSQTPPGSMQRAQQWTSVPMRPLVLGERIIARLLYATNPLLVCLDTASGKINWIVESREREALASDPLMIEGQLVVLSVAQPADQPAMLRWYAFDPQTGEIVRQRDVVELRSTWTTRLCCQVAATGDGLIAALGGATVAVDASGNLRWARSQTAVPADEDARWVWQLYQPPLVAGRRVYVAQPGVRAIDCLAADTGRRHWTAVLPELIGLSGLAGEELIVRTETDLRALRTDDGTTTWRYAAAGPFDTHLVDRERILLAGSEPAPDRTPDKNDERRGRLVWLNAANGRPVGAASLPKLADPEPRLGPIVSHQGHVFVFFGRGQQEATRDLVELTSRGDAEPIHESPTAWHALAEAALKN
jgi:outer membrane protein assembly factor BamB